MKEALKERGNSMRNLIYLLTFAVFTVGYSGHATAQDSRQITVVGTGTVTAKPDILRITVGVVAHEEQARDAVRKMSDDLTRVMEVLADEGLPPADIQTSGLRLSERYDDSRNYDGIREVVGFSATSQVTVVVRDLNRSGAILDRLVTEGVNQINSLEFDLSDREPMLEQARIAAVTDAVAKTALYAQAAHVKAGAIMSISEVSNSATNRGQVMAMTETRNVPIAAGTLDVTAQVTVVTAIE